MKPNTPEDVWKFIVKGKKNSCWLWLGGTFSGRYGRFFLAGKSVCAHRVVCELVNGPIPRGYYALHKCNNKLCCNPRHLIAGTNSQNQMHASMSGAFKLGATGIRGVGFDKKRNYWHAQGYEGGKKRTLYQGPYKEKALAARSKWESERGITFNLGDSK